MAIGRRDVAAQTTSSSATGGRAMTEEQGIAGGESCSGCSVGRAREVAVVGVKFHNLAKVEHYNSEGFELEIDEAIVVESEDGDRFGVVSEATSRTAR